MARKDRRFIKSFTWGDPAPLTVIKDPATGLTLGAVRRRPQMNLLEEVHIFNGGFRVPSLVREAMIAPGNDNIEIPQDLKWQTMKGGMKRKLVPVFYLVQEDKKTKYPGSKIRELDAERGCGAAYTKKQNKLKKAA